MQFEIGTPGFFHDTQVSCQPCSCRKVSCFGLSISLDISRYLTISIDIHRYTSSSSCCQGRCYISIYLSVCLVKPGAPSAAASRVAAARAAALKKPIGGTLPRKKKSDTAVPQQTGTACQMEKKILFTTLLCLLFALNELYFRPHQSRFRSNQFLTEQFIR